MSHSPDVPDPRKQHPRGRRSIAHRLARHTLWAVGCAALATLVLAIAVSSIFNSSVSGRGARPASSGLRARHAGRVGAAVERSGGSAHAAARRARAAGPRVVGTPVGVSIAARPTGAAVGTNFVGLSFEMRSVPTLAGYADRGDLAAMLRSIGPGVMRLGGASADEQAAWVQSGAARPGWASTTITEADLAGIAALARTSGWEVLLTVNLGHYDPAAAAQEAATARRLMGSYLAGIEIGNEPDLYVRKHMRAPGWGIAAYESQAGVYRAAIEAAAPGVAIAGPDPSTGLAGLRWVRAAAATLHPQLLTDHYYPLSNCDYAPTLSELESPNVRRSESEVLAKTVAIARTYATPLRVDETNSVSCEGRAGVSNTFAAALWALDYATRAMAAGAAGVNFHDLIAKPDAYSPLFARGPSALAAGALQAAPEWYGLLAARIFIGSHPPGRSLHTRIVGTTAGELSVNALRTPDGRMHVVLIDYDPPGSPPLAVHLHVPRSLTGGSVLRLTAPSPAATTGARLGGRAVAPDGTWTPPATLPRVSDRAGSLAVQIAPSSAAVLTLSPGPIGRAALPR